uniref:NADH dehydrogenase [ubiquinone] 1 alpha subcomplex assembly factor 4 n=1 Tax=Caenorhabditis tropicalis TaxID=1561998 RepID=A0A1I7TPB9_9PELO
MASRLAASRIVHAGRGISQPTPFGKRMDRLSNRVWGEVVMPTDTKSLKLSTVQRDHRSPEEELKALAEQELWMDYSSFDEFELQIPGFPYDFDTKVLSLSGQASSRISLNIPILAALFNTSTPFETTK